MTAQRQVERAYLDKLAAGLRMRGLSADQIGDILAEVETHVSMTGEPARVAFGPPAQYARMWTPRVDQPDRVDQPSGASRAVIVSALVLVVWGLLEVLFAFGFSHGRWSGIPSGGWVWGLTLALVVVSPVMGAKKTLIDPFTGRPPAGFARECLTGVVFGAVMCGSAIGLYMSVLGAFQLGYGNGPSAAAIDVGIGHWWLLGIGLPLVVTGATVLPATYNFGTDPRSGRPFGGPRRRLFLILASVAIVSPLAFFGLGLLLRLLPR